MLLRILRLAGRLPLACLHRAGAALGWLAYWSSPSYAARLRENLYASGVCSGTTQWEARRRAAIAEAGKGVAELAAVWFGADEQVEQRVECGQWDVVERARG